MKFTDRKLPSIRLFRSRESKERDKFIQDSLASSFVLSERLAHWSSSYDPQSRLCVMNFDEEWQKSDCAVMKWYELQTCKQFRSIQHWRNLDTQFYHEFLIIILIDGSACRIERMGEGSRADAIRRVGCTAFDLIQWFSVKDHAAKRWSHGSDELIIEVEFHTPFDLLDVLAVCYTIQHKSPRASQYTLQRFNCYFLCNTILAVLTRRVAEWETLTTDEGYAPFIDSMVDELERLSLLPVEKQQATDFLALGICSLLHPSSANPKGFLLELLRLKLQTDGFDGLRKKLAAMLWYKHVDAVIDEYLFGFADEMVNAIKDSPEASSLLTLLGEVDPQRYPPIGLELSTIHNTISKEALTIFFRFMTGTASIALASFQMQELENRSPLRLRLLGSMLGRLSCLVPMSLLGIFFPSEPMKNDNDAARLCNRVGVNMSQMVSSVPLTGRSDIVKMMFFDNDVDHDVDMFGISQHFLSVLNPTIGYGAERLFSILLTYLHPDSGVPNVPAALLILNNCLPLYIWKWVLGSCLMRQNKSGLHSLLSLKASTIVTCSFSKTQAVQKVQTIAEFQTYIHERIHAHAKRVESFQLAAAPLVQKDIERSMSQVWRSLPSGFGARGTLSACMANE